MTTYMDMRDNQKQVIDANTHPTGYIVSHRGYEQDENYPKLVYQSVTVTGLDPSQDDVIILEFETFSLSHSTYSYAEGQHLCYDYLWIDKHGYDCENQWNYSTKSFEIYSVTFKFTFKTDAEQSNDGAGFKFRYTGKVRLAIGQQTRFFQLSRRHHSFNIFYSKLNTPPSQLLLYIILGLVFDDLIN